MPIIYSKRFTLRPYRWGDEDSLVENISNENIARSTLRIPYPYEKRDARCWINRNLQLGRAKNRGEIQFAIDVNGNVIGGIGLEKMDGHEAEIGYWLGETYWRQGIMTSALDLVTAYAFAELGLGKISAYVFPSNKASMRVLEKAGYQFMGRLISHYSKEGEPVDSMLFTKYR